MVTGPLSFLFFIPTTLYYYMLVVRLFHIRCWICTQIPVMPEWKKEIDIIFRFIGRKPKEVPLSIPTICVRIARNFEKNSDETFTEEEFRGDLPAYLESQDVPRRSAVELVTAAPVAVTIEHPIVEQIIERLYINSVIASAASRTVNYLTCVNLPLSFYEATIPLVVRLLTFLKSYAWWE